jgi:hypothetical protein
MMKSLFYGTCVLLFVVTCICLSAPEPAIVPGPGEWTVDVTFEHPQQIVLQPGVQGTPRRFWYTIITLVNNTNQDVDFYPTCDLMTDTFQILPAGKFTSPEVFELIKIRHQSKYPLLEPLQKSGNKILQGEDNAKDIAIIWPDFDVKATSFQIFIAGLSNETVAIDHPVQKDETGRPIKVYLRKTLELSYSLRGDPRLRSDLGLAYKGKRWIMR